MSRSLIQTANPSSQAVAVGGIISLGSVLRRFGCNCRMNGNAIEIEGAGYYTISGTFTVEPTAAGDVTVVILENGVQIAGATATVNATAGNAVTLPIVTTVRQGCCCDGASSITCVLTAGAGNVLNASLRVEKE